MNDELVEALNNIYEIETEVVRTKVALKSGDPSAMAHMKALSGMLKSMAAMLDAVAGNAAIFEPRTQNPDEDVDEEPKRNPDHIGRDDILMGRVGSFRYCNSHEDEPEERLASTYGSAQVAKASPNQGRANAAHPLTQYLDRIPEGEEPTLDEVWAASLANVMAQTPILTKMIRHKDAWRRQIEKAKAHERKAMAHHDKFLEARRLFNREIGVGA